MYRAILLSNDAVIGTDIAPSSLVIKQSESGQGIGIKSLHLGDTYRLAPGRRALTTVPFNYGAHNLNLFPCIVVHVNGGVALQEVNKENNKKIFKYR